FKVLARRSILTVGETQGFAAHAGVVGFAFLFSSRRRHTSSYGDWSSDVCSSDLARALAESPRLGKLAALRLGKNRLTARMKEGRSEERRVGKECRTGGWT